MRARILLTLAIAAMLVAAISILAVAGDRREAPMQPLPTPSQAIEGASVQVNATSDTARIRVKTSGLEDGYAYTLWSFSFSNPGACIGGCGSDDADDRPGLVGFAVHQVAGHIVGNGDKVNFGGSIKVENAAGAEYHIVVADHGALDPGALPGQIKTPAGGVQIGIILP